MSYIGRDIRTGAFRQLYYISSGFDGSDTTHTMQVNSTNVSVGDVNQILLSLGGGIQKPGTDFTVSGSTLTFTTAPAANTSFFAILLGSDNGGTVTPTDVSVTKAKLADEIDIFAGTSLSAADLGAGIHIKSGDAGTVTASSQADDLVVENSAEGGITIITPDDQSARIRFTSPSTNTDVGGATIFYRQNINKMNVGTAVAGGILDLQSGAGASAINADANGHVTMPKQPAFQATPSGTQSNIATGSNVQIEFGTERFDVNGDFASHTFTAPVTGKYQLNAQLRFQSVDTAADYYQLRLATSNRTYGPLIDPGPFGSDPEYWNISFSVVADMDANDTAIVSLRQQGGTQQTDIDDASHFSGCLLA